jgi:hypothetical protein
VDRGAAGVTDGLLERVLVGVANGVDDAGGEGLGGAVAGSVKVAAGEKDIGRQTGTQEMSAPSVKQSMVAAIPPPVWTNPNVSRWQFRKVVLAAEWIK